MEQTKPKYGLVGSLGWTSTGECFCLKCRGHMSFLIDIDLETLMFTVSCARCGADTIRTPSLRHAEEA